MTKIAKMMLTIQTSLEKLRMNLKNCIMEVVVDKIKASHLGERLGVN